MEWPLHLHAFLQCHCKRRFFSFEASNDCSCCQVEWTFRCNLLRLLQKVAPTTESLGAATEASGLDKVFSSFLKKTLKKTRNCNLCKHFKYLKNIVFTAWASARRNSSGIILTTFSDNGTAAIQSDFVVFRTRLSSSTSDFNPKHTSSFFLVDCTSFCSSSISVILRRYSLEEKLHLCPIPVRLPSSLHCRNFTKTSLKFLRI